MAIRGFMTKTTVPISFGTWELDEWKNSSGEVYKGVKIVPDHAPWRDVFGFLDAYQVRDTSPSRIIDETDAIVLCCWRHGSYASVLADGIPNTLFKADPNLSRITDEEMCRINIEFSAGVADWLSTRAANPEVIQHRVRAALEVFPCSWRTGRSPIWDDYEEWGGKWPDEEASFPRGLVSEYNSGHPRFAANPIATLREQANYIVLMAYRNGPIENVHSGTGYTSDMLGMKRLYAPDIGRTASKTSQILAQSLMLRSNADIDVWSGIVRLLAPPNWTENKETSEVSYFGENFSSIAQRFATLATKFPSVYTPLWGVKNITTSCGAQVTI
jgi:hypothetical protein